MPIDEKTAAAINKQVAAGTYNPGNVGSLLKEVKSGVGAEKPTPEVPSKPDGSKLSNWDKTYQPLVEEFGMQKDINYETSKHIIRAVNGRYDGVMSKLKTEDPALYKKFSAFKNKSWDFAKELENIKETGNTDNLNKYYKDTALMFSEIQAVLDPAKSKKYVVDDQARVLTREQYDKYDQGVQVGKNSSISANVIFDQGEFKAQYESWGTSAEYNKLHNISNWWQKEIEKKSQPIVSSWSASTLKSIDPKESSKSKQNNLAWNLNVDILRQVSEHGTVDNPDRRNIDKNTAMSIRKQMWGKSYEDQLQVLKDNAEDIQGMTDRMGFHGTRKILNTHKNTVGKYSQYYPETSEKTRDEFADEITDIERMGQHYKEFKEVDKNFRNKAVQLSKNNYQVIVDSAGLDMNQKLFNSAMDALVDKDGNILSYERWKQQLRATGDPTNHYYNKKGNDVFGSTFKNSKPENMAKRSALGQIWEQNKTTDWNHLGAWNPFYAFGGYEHRREGVEEDLTDVYNAMKSGYKKQFSNIKSSQVYQSSLMAQGFGDLRNQTLMFKGLDMNVDKNYKLKATTDPKQENLNKLINLMTDDSGQITTENITLFSDKQVNAGLKSKQKDDLVDQRKLNNDVAKEFFKGDMSNVTMEFYRNTNVPGQASYVFHNQKTNKKMAMYVPKTMLSKEGGIGEDMYVNTARSPQDFVFQAKGYKDMPIKMANGKPAYESARLTFDNDKNAYIGTMWYWDGDGNKQKFEHIIPMGHAITIKGATDNFNDFLSQYSRSF